MTSEVGLSFLEDPRHRPFEIVERKGIGHPDTICDALAERLSAALCRFYVDRFGFVLHHNVDKVLLRGGAAAPRFGGGEVTEPIEIFLAGRATRRFKVVGVPLEDMAQQVAGEFFRQTFHALDFERHVRVHCLIRPGSDDLVDLFMRQRRTGKWLANDSSIGVGFAPLSGTESAVLAVDRLLTSPAVGKAHRAFGEDTKLLAVRRDSRTDLTVACAFRDRYVANVDDYLGQKAELAAMVARAVGGDVKIEVNAADDPGAGSLYLTVTGTSAEAGDDGEAGRGNRANGLITPGRPMTMESLAGKNPVSHIGKLYNLAASAIAEAIVRDVPEAAAAECYLASQIGRPVAEPQFAHVRIATRDGRPLADLGSVIEPIVGQQLARLDTLWRSVLDDSLTVF